MTNASTLFGRSTIFVPLGANTSVLSGGAVGWLIDPTINGNGIELSHLNIAGYSSSSSFTRSVYITNTESPLPEELFVRTHYTGHSIHPTFVPSGLGIYVTGAGGQSTIIAKYNIL